MRHLINPINQIKTRKLLVGISIFILVLFSFRIARAQNKLNVTFRPSANFPTKGLGETELNNCGGMEAIVYYSFIKHFAVYAGWGWNPFTEKVTSTDSQNQFNETGYTFGLQYIHPFSPESKLNIVIGAGCIYDHIEIESKNGDLLYDTGHGLGWQAEGGLAIPIGHHNRWELIPSLRYHSLSTDITYEGISDKAELNYFSIGMAVSWNLWRSQ